MADEPFIFKVLDISTGHMSSEDAAALEECDVTFPSYELGEYGWLVYSKGLVDHREQFNDMSPYFIKVLEWANEMGCDYVRFDRDGTTYEGLTVFEW